MIQESRASVTASSTSFIPGSERICGWTSVHRVAAQNPRDGCPSCLDELIAAVRLQGVRGARRLEAALNAEPSRYSSPVRLDETDREPREPSGAFANTRIGLV